MAGKQRKSDRVRLVAADRLDEMFSQFQDEIHSVPSEILVAAVRGDLDVVQLCKAELMNRGHNDHGAWIGFPESRRFWNQWFFDAGRRRWFCIPDDDQDGE